jgi:hypothetical protein
MDCRPLVMGEIGAELGGMVTHAGLAGGDVLMGVASTCGVCVGERWVSAE